MIPVKARERAQFTDPADGSNAGKEETSVVCPKFVPEHLGLGRF
jgi:hypothetical protein